MSESNNAEKEHFDPAATVTAVVTRMNEGVLEVLLTFRAIEPFKGIWCLPGGHIDQFEQSYDAIVREVNEETGLGFEGEYFGTFDEIFRDLGIHNVVAAYAGSGAGQLVKGSEVSDIAWVPLDKAREMSLAFEHKKGLDAFARWYARNCNDARDGLLEEFRALRGETISILNARLWGTATYMVLVLGIIAALKGNPEPFHWLFLIWASIPFLLHTAYRERARIRAGVYIKEKIEPYIRGLDWEAFVDRWRSSLGNGKEKSVTDRILHITGIAGLYILVMAVATIKCITSTSQEAPPSGVPNWLIATLSVAGLFLASAALWKFFTLYEQIEKQTRDVCTDFHRNPRLH